MRYARFLKFPSGLFRPSLKRVEHGSNLQTFLKFFQRKRLTRMEFDGHTSSGCEVEEIVGEEAVMLCDRKIDCLREFVSRNLHTVTTANRRNFGSDRWFREGEIFEWREEEVV